MDHPSQGKTQLFAAQVDPATYRAILEHPRVHTGDRYHTRNNDQRKGRNRNNQRRNNKNGR